ncbi:MAG: DegT/DnrJ/EryC1/StrS family aminotransferase [Thaumarchaeota archaeon]|nr:DegT/DnrJ/EryC1/StrS family aminotransferase [Nitrososphaerota archaeon]
MPFFSPWVTNSDRKAVMDALHSTFLTDGPKLRQFESDFAKFTGTRYAIGVSNATSALFLSLKACGIGKGDEVILPDLTFVATANAVVHTGATPVFTDVDKEEMNISINSIKNNITKKTKVILPVHFAGRACNMKEIIKIAKSNNLMVIEDCAHAIGATSQKKHVGTFGDAGCFSFYPTKNITTVEGGMIITNSKKIAEYVNMARNHGITKSLIQRYTHGKPWDYDVVESGYNFRLDEIRSSLGISQLKRIRKLNFMRKKAHDYYNSKLSKIKGVITPVSSRVDHNAYHLYIIRIEKEYGINRDELFRRLLERGISTSVHYKPLHQFTVFRKFKNHTDNLKNTIALYSEMISLPFYPNITRNEQDIVIKGIQESSS